ncbi:DUF4886 domain-containing protein [Flavobacteriaceae bacterium D16]|nr:DUF4886 domain-containing protein [Flavobacteriaceae bacterium D16]
MKNIFTVFLLLISTIVWSQKQEEEINVLFIGNSLTYFHDMPQMVQEMVAVTHPNMVVEQSTFPGMSLSAHLDNIIESRTEHSISTRKKEEGELTDTEMKIAEKKWDVVILQTGTVAVLIPEARELKVEKAISEIKRRINNPDCKFILFETWPSKEEFPKEYCYSSWSINGTWGDEQFCSPIIENLELEIKLIKESYNLIAQNQGLIKSNNGSIFYEIRTKHPEIELLEDTIHPNKTGAFLNACIFYKLLTGKKPSVLKYNGEIEPKTVNLIKTIVNY